jgi:hypothetical protein
MTSTKQSLPKIAGNVLFATVKWNEPESPEQERREQILKTNWKNMIDKGSQVARLKDTISPWSIVDKLLERPAEPGVLQQHLNAILGERLNRECKRGFLPRFFGGVTQSNVSPSPLQTDFPVSSLIHLPFK